MFFCDFVVGISGELVDEREFVVGNFKFSELDLCLCLNLRMRVVFLFRSRTSFRH
jgi:hypothetical protein